MSCLKLALVGPFPAQACLRSEQIKSSRRLRWAHPVTWIGALCEGLSARPGVDARLFVHSRDVAQVETGFVGKVKCVFIPKFEPGHFDPVFGDFTAQIQFHSHVKEFSPDVVLGFGTESMYGLLASAFNVPSVIFIQGIVDKLPLESYGKPKWQHGFMRRLERRSIVRTDAVIAENRFAADWAVSVNPKLKYAVIPHVIAKEFLVSDSSYGQRIVFIGSLNTNKRPDMVARAFASIAGDHPHAELVIIGNGSGDIIGRINDLIRHKELGGRIRLTGALSRREVIMELSGSCCLVSASIMDTSPNVITEAHACGVPVVATRIGGIPEMVADGVDGFLVDVDDEEAMARYMSLLLFDRSLSEQMGKRGKIKVTELNIAQNVIRSYVDFLRSLKGYKIEERKMK